MALNLQVEVEATAEMDIAMSTMYAAMQTRLRQALLRGPANARRRVVELQFQQVPGGGGEFESLR
jgi:hypothetical protein